ncbi:DUF2306 domain-containing protein [Qipengyuania nanhaisediminis]|uniref:DUF2306 domain-containing protein n=1 Tax=Qipengyuania nanhaisediminis TaxID=604088 RepID=UPI0038B2B352
MTTITMPFAARENARPQFDNGPVTRGVIGLGGSLVTLAAGIALFKWLTGLAPDLAHYRNLAIVIHVATVLPCVPLGAYLLLSTKGTGRHKRLGKLWVALMVTSAIAITFVRGGTDFSWIHIFVPYTLLGAVQVIRTARTGNIAGHRMHITGMYLFALVLPGLISFHPERLMGLWLMA